MCGIYLYARNQFLNANHKEVCESNIGDKKDDDSIDEKSRTQPRVSQSNRGPSANNHITIQDRSFMPLEFTGSNGLVNRTTTVDMHFDRLQIIGDSKGLQPFQLENIYLMANAEIYNYLELSAKYNIPLDKIKSDCGIILHLYKLLGIDTMIEQLDGEFAFVIYDNGIIHMARDRCGIKPLYYYYYLDEFACASTVKALHMSPYQLPPGSMLSYNMHQPYIKHINNIPMRHYAINIQTYNIFKYLPINGGTYDSLRCCGVANNAVSGDATNNDAADVVANIRKTRKDNTDRDIYDSLVAAVQKRITMHNGEVEVGFFLSGGLDSSIILALAMEIYDKTCGFPQPIKVFTFGFHKEAPDVISASKVVEYLKSKYGGAAIDWRLIICELSTGIDALDDTIYAIETFDTTTVRASVPMYIMSLYVSTQTNVKVILSGEGSDELFGGYLYFRYTPDEYAYRREIVRLLSEIHLFDVQRAERCTASCGLELRPPFLDSTLIAAVLRSPHLYPCKNNTKSLLRHVIAVYNGDLLPECILYGKKEALSDAVGYGWRTTVKSHAEAAFNDIPNNCGLTLCEHIENATIEQKYYQYLYKKYVGGAFYLLPHLWLPQWTDTNGEPSATVLGVYSK